MPEYGINCEFRPALVWSQDVDDVWVPIAIRQRAGDSLVLSACTIANLRLNPKLVDKPVDKLPIEFIYLRFVVHNTEFEVRTLDGQNRAFESRPMFGESHRTFERSA